MIKAIHFKLYLCLTQPFRIVDKRYTNNLFIAFTNPEFIQPKGNTLITKENVECEDVNYCTQKKSVHVFYSRINWLGEKTNGTTVKLFSVSFKFKITIDMPKYDTIACHGQTIRKKITAIRNLDLENSCHNQRKYSNWCSLLHDIKYVSNWQQKLHFFDGTEL